MRALLTCRPLAGHYRPMLPLARSLAEAGHDVAFASGEPVVGEAEAEGFTAFRVGLAMDSAEPLARRVRGLAASLPPSQVRSFVFTELFVRVELEPRANDLFEIIEQWSPHVVVHDVAEFAAPLVATSGRHPVRGAQLRTRRPERRHPCRRQGDCPLLDLARPCAAPPRWLLPLPVPRRVPTQPPGTRSGCGRRAGHPYGRDSATGDAAPVAGWAARPADRLHHARHRLQPQPRRVPGAARRPPRRSAEHRRHRRQAERPCGARSRSRRTSTCTSTSRKSYCSLTAPLS